MRTHTGTAHRYRNCAAGNSRRCLIHLGLTQLKANRLRVCAVSYLNTAPLVWGMLHGPQQGLFDLDFRIPAGCADALASGRADIGIVPSF